MLWGIGITYMVMGGFPLLVNHRYRLDLNPLMLWTYKWLLGTGMASLCLYSLGFFFDQAIQSLMAVIPVFVMGVVMFRQFRRTITDKVS